MDLAQILYVYSTSQDKQSSTKITFLAASKLE